MKKPKKENLERHSDICLVDTETGGSYIEIADTKLVTLIRSAFEDDGLKIGKEFLMNEEEVKNLNENLRKTNSENSCFIIEDLKTRKFLGIFKIHSGQGEIIVKYPLIKAVNSAMNEYLKQRFRDRVMSAVNQLCIETELVVSAVEYRVN